MDSRDYSHYALSHLYSVSSSENEGIPHSPYYSTFTPFEEDSKDSSENSESHDDSGSDSSSSEESAEPFEYLSWSERFNVEIRKDDDIVKWMTLSDIASDFSFIAQIYGQIIISESHLPPSNRTIHPIDGGLGLHGGTKYVVQDMIFKFATDQMVGDIWMFGEKRCNDEFAHKSASSEILGWRACFFSPIKLFSFPLVALTQFRGYTLVAVSKLPIDLTTIVYGSCDGGKTVHTANADVNRMMLLAGKLFNLQTHFFQNHELAGPGDIEIHLKDNKFYMIDYGRLMPPEHPMARGSFSTSSREIFYRFFRPEFLKKYPKPLCSDALSGWLSTNYEARTPEFNREVLLATKYLQDLVPQFCQFLMDLCKDTSALSYLCSGWDIEEITDATGLQDSDSYYFQLKQSSKYPKSIDFLKYLLRKTHDFGIGFRHLGVVRRYLLEIYKKCKEEFIHKITSLLLVECVARAIKNEIREKYRIQMQIVKTAVETPYKKVVFEYLQDVLYKKNIKSKLKKICSLHACLNIPLDEQYLNNGEDVMEVLRLQTSVPIEKAQQYTQSNAIETAPQIINYYKYDVFDSPSVFMEIQLLEINLIIFGVMKKDATNKDFPIALVCDGEKKFYICIYDSAQTQKIICSGIKENSHIGILLVQNRNVIFTHDKEIIYDYTFSSDQIGIHSPACIIGNGSKITYRIDNNNNLSAFHFDIQDYISTHKIPSSTCIGTQTKSSSGFWHRKVKNHVEKRFPNCLSPSEQKEAYNLQKNVDLPLLVERLKVMLGIEFSPRVGRMEESEDAIWILNDTDIVSISSVSKSMMITEFSDAIAKIIQHQYMTGFEPKSVFSLQHSQNDLLQAIFAIKQTINSSPCCGRYYYYWLGEGYYQLSWQYNSLRDQQKAVRLARDRLAFDPYAARGFDESVLAEIEQLECENVTKCQLKLCLIAFELEFFFYSGESGERRIEDIERLVRSSFVPILEQFEKYEHQISVLINELEARIFDLVMKSKTSFLKRAIHLLIGLTILLVSKTSDTVGCNLLLNLFNVFIPLDANVNIDAEFNFTVTMCLDRYQDRFREIFNSKYSRNGIHGAFLVRILKIYDSNLKFEILLSDLLKDEKLKIYNRKPLMEYLEDKLKTENQNELLQKIYEMVLQEQMKQQQNRSENLSNSRKSRKQQEKQQQQEDQARQQAENNGQPYRKSHMVNIEEYMQAHGSSPSIVLANSALAATANAASPAPVAKTSTAKAPAKGFQLFRPLRKDSFTLGGSVPKFSETMQSFSGANSANPGSGAQPSPSSRGNSTSQSAGSGAASGGVPSQSKEEIRRTVKLMTENTFFADNQPFHDYFEELLENSIQVLRVGEITKLGGQNKNWKRRFLVLTDDLKLTYFSYSKSSFVKKGSLALKEITECQTLHQYKGKYFFITMDTTFGRTYYIQCRDEEDSFEWMKVIRSHVLSVQLEYIQNLQGRGQATGSMDLRVPLAKSNSGQLEQKPSPHQQQIELPPMLKVKKEKDSKDKESPPLAASTASLPSNASTANAAPESRTRAGSLKITIGGRPSNMKEKSKAVSPTLSSSAEPGRYGSASDDFTAIAQKAALSKSGGAERSPAKEKLSENSTATLLASPTTVASTTNQDVTPSPQHSVPLPVPVSPSPTSHNASRSASSPIKSNFPLFGSSGSPSCSPTTPQSTSPSGAMRASSLKGLSLNSSSISGSSATLPAPSSTHATSPRLGLGLARNSEGANDRSERETKEAERTNTNSPRSNATNSNSNSPVHPNSALSTSGDALIAGGETGRTRTRSFSLTLLAPKEITSKSKAEKEHASSSIATNAATQNAHLVAMALKGAPDCLEDGVEVVKGDWIVKQGAKQRKNYNNWKTRYLALEVDEKLSYYSQHEKKGEILTKNILDCGFMNNYSGRNNIVFIQTTTDRTYYIQCKDEENAFSWIYAIMEEVSNYNEKL